MDLPSWVEVELVKSFQLENGRSEEACHSLWIQLLPPPLLYFPSFRFRHCFDKKKLCIYRFVQSFSVWCYRSFFLNNFKFINKNKSAWMLNGGVTRCKKHFQYLLCLRILEWKCQNAGESFSDSAFSPLYSFQAKQKFVDLVVVCQVSFNFNFSCKRVFSFVIRGKVCFFLIC